MRERRCHLVTVFGPAGIGKTRLAQELARSVEGEATRAHGPLPLLRGGDHLLADPGDRRAGGRRTAASRSCSRAARTRTSSPSGSSAAIGAGTGGAVKEEIFWAVRKLVEALARETPLVLVFEDVHWGEPTLLDLIEHLADWVRDVPVLLVCLARPELLDERPAWGGGKLNATSHPARAALRGGVRRADRRPPSGRELAPEARARIAEAAAGNPLFLEQMLAMLAEGEDGVRRDRRAAGDPGAARRPARPARARRAPRARARLDRGGDLPRRRGRRALRHRRHGTRSRPPDEPRAQGADPRRGAATLPGEEAFRFRHALIRDAAYEGLPKEARAELHERYAAWLEQALGDRLGGGRGVPRLPPRAGLPVSLRARPGRRGGARARRPRPSAARPRPGGSRFAAATRGRRSTCSSAPARCPPPTSGPGSSSPPTSASRCSRPASSSVPSPSSARRSSVRAAIGERHIERHAWLVRGMLRQFSQPERIDLAAIAPRGRGVARRLPGSRRRPRAHTRVELPLRPLPVHRRRGVATGRGRTGPRAREAGRQPPRRGHGASRASATRCSRADAGRARACGSRGAPERAARAIPWGRRR